MSDSCGHPCYAMSDRHILLSGDPWKESEDLADESLIEWLNGALEALQTLSAAEKRLLSHRDVMHQFVLGSWESTEYVDSVSLRAWLWRTLGARASRFPRAARAVAAGLAPCLEDQSSLPWWTGFVQGVAAAATTLKGVESTSKRGSQDGPSTCSTASTLTHARDDRYSDINLTANYQATSDCLTGYAIPAPGCNTVLQTALHEEFLWKAGEVSQPHLIKASASIGPTRVQPQGAEPVEQACPVVRRSSRTQMQSIFADSCTHTTVDKWLRPALRGHSQQVQADVRVEQSDEGSSSSQLIVNTRALPRPRSIPALARMSRDTPPVAVPPYPGSMTGRNLPGRLHL